MKNYRLTISYQGSAYHGWQIQHNADTVQGRLVNALQILLKEDCNLIGAGRTDTGVHALGQVANFRTEQVLDIYRFLHSMNGILPQDISVLQCVEVPESFHARFDAISREYRYYIHHKKNPFLHERSYFMHQAYQPSLLNAYAKCFLGKHEFHSFSKELPENQNAYCTIEKCFWRSTGEVSILTIEADRFLHGMVRLIAGSMLHAAKNNAPAQWLEEMLLHPTENRFAVPPVGLYLYKVKYDK